MTTAIETRTAQVTRRTRTLGIEIRTWMVNRTNERGVQHPEPDFSGKPDFVGTLSQVRRYYATHRPEYGQYFGTQLFLDGALIEAVEYDGLDDQSAPLFRLIEALYSDIPFIPSVDTVTVRLA